MVLSCVISEVKRDIGRKSRFFIPPLHSTPQLRGSRSENRHKVWCAKNRVVRLPDGEKGLTIRLLVLTESTNVTDGTDGTDGRTPHDGKAALA